MKTKFADVENGQVFRYDGEVFIKTADRLAWALRTVGDKRVMYKEWAFSSGDEVIPE